MSLTGPEYMWIMSSIVLCNYKKQNFNNFFFESFLATYSSGSEAKISPYDNPNRRKMEFFAGTLALYNDVTRGRTLFSTILYKDYIANEF